MTVLTKDTIIKKLKEIKPYLNKRYGVEKIALYGSFVRGDFTEDSDVDILIESSKPLGLEFIELANYLEKILDRRVDITTFTSMQRNFQKSKSSRIAREVEKSMSYV